MINLDALIEVITTFAGVTRKKSIKNITNNLKDVYNVGGKTLLNFGDDASAIEIILEPIGISSPFIPNG